MLNSINNISSLKRRIINGKVIEYDYLKGVYPIMDKNSDFYKEICFEPPQNFNNFFDWYKYVEKNKLDILERKNESFNLNFNKRDEVNIANFSCIPWVDFEAMTNIVIKGNAIQPLITWGKVNKNYEMTVSITVSHIFVHGRDLGYLFQNIQNNFNNVNFEK